VEPEHIFSIENIENIKQQHRALLADAEIELLYMKALSNNRRDCDKSTLSEVAFLLSNTSNTCSGDERLAPDTPP